jgi:hypothetical protein
MVANVGGRIPLTAYDERLRALRRQLRASAFMAAFVYRFPRFAFERMARSPYASRLFAGVITGEVRPTECLARAVATAPYWMVGGGRAAGR